MQMDETGIALGVCNNGLVLGSSRKATLMLHLRKIANGYQILNVPLLPVPIRVLLPFPKARRCKLGARPL